MKAELISTRRRAPRVSTRVRADRTVRKTLQIRNVLVPTDFSPPSLEAIQFALPLIKRFGADLHLAHVFASDYPITALVAMPLVLPEVEINKSVHRHLKDVAKKYSIELPRENIHALEGRPFEEICRLARDISIDLIVIATRGNTGIKHLLLGSTTERVVRYSRCPVLVTRDCNPPRRATSFRKVLVPIDFSECSMRGLTYAQAFANQFNSRLVLLNSVHLQYYVASDEYARYDLPRLMQYTEKTAREQMHDLVEKTDWGGLRVETSLQTGHAGQQICDGARDGGADLIVTSTHGRTGFKHVLLGSTAEYVVRHAHCPVLVVPSHERPALTSTKTQT
jgi:nucleotide-binding universal stress UspA family protein